MANKKKYYELDDVGLLGVVVNRSAVAIKRDAHLTSEFIKKYRAGIVSVVKEAVVVVHARKETTLKTAAVTATGFSAKKKQHAHTK